MTQEDASDISGALSVHINQRPSYGPATYFDALPGLSQEASPERKARVAGAAGHGCGHNLFAVASALAAITV